MLASAPPPLGSEMTSDGPVDERILLRRAQKESPITRVSPPWVVRLSRVIGPRRGSPFMTTTQRSILEKAVAGKAIDEP